MSRVDIYSRVMVKLSGDDLCSTSEVIGTDIRLPMQLWAPMSQGPQMRISINGRSWERIVKFVDKHS